VRRVPWGDLMRKVLAERNFPIKSIKFLASEKSAGKSVEFAGKTVHRRTDPARSPSRAVQIVLSSTPSFRQQRVFTPSRLRRGAIVVDNSSAWRMDPELPAPSCPK